MCEGFKLTRQIKQAVFTKCIELGLGKFSLGVEPIEQIHTIVLESTLTLDASLDLEHRRRSSSKWFQCCERSCSRTILRLIGRVLFLVGPLTSDILFGRICKDPFAQF